LTGLIGVVVDGLLAEDYEVRLLVGNDSLEQLGDGERLQVGVRLDQDRPVRPQRQRRPQRLLAGR
jgi:hypothetical protein